MLVLNFTFEDNACSMFNHDDFAYKKPRNPAAAGMGCLFHDLDLTASTSFKVRCLHDVSKLDIRNILLIGTNSVRAAV